MSRKSMEGGHINLKSSDFLTNIFSSFNNLHNSDLFTDVTLVTDDNKKIEAHKLILSVGSEYFRDILSDKSHPHPMLCLDGVSSEDLACIIKYLYVGEVSVPQSSLQKFVRIANKFKCLGLNDYGPQGSEREEGECENFGNESSYIFENDHKTELVDKNSELEVKDNEPEDIEAEAEITNESLTNLIEEKKKSSFPECRIDGKPISKDHLSKVLKEHYHYNHDRFFQCNHCEYSSKYLTNVKEHTQKYIPNFECECDICGKIFQGTQILRNHKRIHNTNSESVMSKFECEYCPNNYVTIQGLNQHQKTVHEGIQYSCNQCEYKSTTEEMLTHHIKTIHEGIRFNCSQCDKKFMKKINLNEHIKTIHEGVRYNCGQCDKKFTRKDKLNTHIKGKHEGIKKLHCDLCEYQTNYQEKFNSHIKSKHEGVRYSCSFCEYQAMHKETLKEHIKAKHEGIRYTCNQCEFQTTSKQALSTHMKAIHEGVRYPCNQCEYQATQQPHLMTHMKSKHQGIKFQCEQCEYQATQKCHLNTHIKNKHI